jgi:hypothetical protein
MSDVEVNTPVGDEADAAARAEAEAASLAATEAKPEAKAAKGKKAAAEKAVAAEPEFKRYVTTEKQSYPFDIQISNVILQGQWTRTSGIVEFNVPVELVEGFEKHHHFVSGNVVAAA